jgi:hypothetical protein
VKRHLRWVIPVLCIPVLYVTASSVISAVRQTPGFDQSVELGFLNLGILLVAFLAIVAAMVLAIVGGVKTFRAWRRRNGHRSPAESAQQLREVHSRLGWTAAINLRNALMQRQVPSTVQVWEVVPEPGEVFFFDVPMGYDRYYGQDVTYGRSGGFFFGHPAFVVAGLAASTIGNAARRQSAEAQARTQWREWQEARVLVTNRRLVCLVAGEWISFHYSAMTAVYPEVRDWALVCEFNGVTSPLRLSGPNAPVAAVMTVFATHGLDAVAQHPSLQALNNGPRQDVATD